MTNEQLAILLGSLQKQLRHAIEAAEESVPENAEREMEWWHIEENERSWGPRKDHNEEESFEQRASGQYIVLLPFHQLDTEIHHMIEEL